MEENIESDILKPRSGVSRGELTYLIVRCFGIHVSNDVLFKNVGTLTNLLVYATTSTIKNERRVIRALQSIPFISTGRPESLAFDEIYESELIEDKQDMSPSLLIPIQCPKDMDCKIQINVFYSSNRTNGKEVYLCGASFLFQDMLKIIKYQHLHSHRSDQKNIYQLNMTSQYCLAAKLYIEMYPMFPPLFTMKSLQICSPNLIKNPISQHYVFYTDEDPITPRIDVCEITYEPRLAFIISELFLSNLSEVIEKSLIAWKNRYHIERMRQGRYISREEAFLHGWAELRVCVLKLKLTPIRNNSILSSNGNNSSGFIQFIPENENFPTTVTTKSSSIGKNGSNTIPTNNRRVSGMKIKKVNELLPCTYININVIDNNQTFNIPIGRTNIEYHTNDAVYGSYINTQYIKKSINSMKDGFVAEPEVSVDKLRKTYNFSVIEIPSIENFETPSCKESGNTSVDNITIEGEEVSFVRFIPNRSNSSIEFELMSIDSNGKRSSSNLSTNERMGTCVLPLTDNDELSLWVPIQLSPEYSKLYESAIIQVLVNVYSHSNDNEIDIRESVQKILLEQKYSNSSVLLPINHLNIPAELNELFEVERLSNGSTFGFEGSSESSLENDYRNIFTNCYSWLWYLGYPDNDPLRSKSLMNPLDDVEIDDLAHRYKRCHRIDCPFPLTYLEEYITKLDLLAKDIVLMKSDVEKIIRSGITFRPSTMKKVPEVQPLPINLHYQFFITRFHDRDTSDLDIDASVTCGSLSPHGLGHKKGGLSLLQHDVYQYKKLMNETKSLYKQEIRSCGNNKISCNHSSYQTRNELLNRIIKYDSTLLDITRRRIIALSQGLSVVLNSFLLKISLVVEGHISLSTAEQWRSHGFLIVFQGLLSVIGNEKSMLEDTLAVVEALHSYKIRIKLSKYSNFPLHDDVQHENIENMSRPMSMRIKANAPVPGKEKHIQHVSYSGREIVIHLHTEVIERLPESFHEDINHDGVLFNLYTVLFSQGIDMQQSVASTFATDAGVAFQGELNMKGLKQLNRYSHFIQPINTHVGFDTNKTIDTKIDEVSYSGKPLKNKYKVSNSTPNSSDESDFKSFNSSEIDQQIHPLMDELINTITSNKVSSKNVDMIAEVERVTQILHGCKVTFCKSGKDRTGMAVTFDQARKLSEKFGVGSSLPSIISNANLQRIYGTRLLIAEKNIGRKKFSINKLQAQFLPVIYRPPAICCEDLMKKDSS